MSANRRIDTLMEARGAGFSIEVRCLRCQRRRVLDASRLLAIWTRRGWPMRIARLHEHLRCRDCRPIDVQVRLTGEKPDGLRQPRQPEGK